MEENNKILVTVVTYNRLNDLKECINALKQQSYDDLDILVVNNGSSDGTEEWLEKQQGLFCIHQENLGGAGGFYAGMKYMMDHDYGWLLMMDDDGIPDQNEVRNIRESYDEIAETMHKEVILNALVVCKDDHQHTAFGWARGSHRSNLVCELKKKRYFNDIHPYNGTLIRRSIIEKIGLVKKEMFIWGDEKEYMARAVHYGIGLYTVTSAIHYHPKEKGMRVGVFPFLAKPKILIKPKKMSHYYYRNEGFIYQTYPEKRKKMWIFFIAYCLRFTLRLDIRELVKFIKYFNRGRKNNYEE